MASFATQGIRALRGRISLSGDKSIAHRAIMLAAIASGTTTVRNLPAHDDAAATLRAFRCLGVKITNRKDSITVRGVGLKGLQPPDGPLFVNESGTTLRLLLGILAGQDFEVTLNAAASLSNRPMLRVIKPLRLMGARISGRRQGKEEYAPIRVCPGPLRAITYKMPVASAQVKSAILFAGLYAKAKTKVIETVLTRDHTERMLRLFKAGVRTSGRTVSLRGCRCLRSPGTILIPGDISSAGFFLVAASLLKGSRLTVRAVCMNPTRIGILGVLQRMGARLSFSAQRRGIGEPSGDITVQPSDLHGVTIQKKDIPSLIDELPVIMVAACNSSGTTIIHGVEELRVKETDRIRSMTDNLIRMGGSIKLVKRRGSEDIIIRGTGQLHGAAVKSYGDHRTAMAMVVAGLAASGRTSIDDVSCISKSFPDFLKVLKSIMSE